MYLTQQIYKNAMKDVVLIFRQFYMAICNSQMCFRVAQRKISINLQSDYSRRKLQDTILREDDLEQNRITQKNISSLSKYRKSFYTPNPLFGG